MARVRGTSKYSDPPRPAAHVEPIPPRILRSQRGTGAAVSAAHRDRKGRRLHRRRRLYGSFGRAPSGESRGPAGPASRPRPSASAHPVATADRSIRDCARTRPGSRTWLGPQHARDLWTLAEESKALVRALVERHEIACALKDGLVIAAHNEKALDHLAQDTAHLAKHYRYDAARMMDADETAAKLGTTIYPGARLDLGGGHLHPLDYARGLAAAAETAPAQCCGSTRRRSRSKRAATAYASVAAPEPSPPDRVLLACDAFSGVDRAQAGRLYRPCRKLRRGDSASAAASGRDACCLRDAAVADTRHVLDYYRKSADGRLLFAGRESYFKPPKDIAALVRPRMLQVFPAARRTSRSNMPGAAPSASRARACRISASCRIAIFFAHGYSGQGVALATLGGKLLAESGDRASANVSTSSRACRRRHSRADSHLRQAAGLGRALCVQDLGSVVSALKP